MRHVPTAWSLSFVLVAGCGAQDGAPDPGATSRPVVAPRHAAFDAMLRQHVRNERVDYLTWRDEDAARLRAYLDELAATDVDALDRDARLAFYINLYNATMIDTILARIDASYSTSDREFAVFDEKIVRSGGATFSLNHLEHEIVRKQFGDARIHAALVCGAASCPPLIPRAYEATDLDPVLDANMRAFVTNGKRNELGKTLRLSQLFNWYADDFGGKDGVRDYLERYADEDLSGRPIEFLEYSWKLNAIAPDPGWVVVERATNGLEKGAIVKRVGADEAGVEVRLPFGRGRVTLSHDDVRAYD